MTCFENLLSMSIFTSLRKPLEFAEEIFEECQLPKSCYESLPNSQEKFECVQSGEGGSPAREMMRSP